MSPNHFAYQLKIVFLVSHKNEKYLLWFGNLCHGFLHASCSSIGQTNRKWMQIGCIITWKITCMNYATRYANIACRKRFYMLFSEYIHLKILYRDSEWNIGPLMFTFLGCQLKIQLCSGTAHTFTSVRFWIGIVSGWNAPHILKPKICWTFRFDIASNTINVTSPILLEIQQIELSLYSMYPHSCYAMSKSMW